MPTCLGFTQARPATQIPLIVSHDKASDTLEPFRVSQLLFQCPSGPFCEYESVGRCYILSLTQYFHQGSWTALSRDFYCDSCFGFCSGLLAHPSLLLYRP